nr:retrotransposon Orf1 [Tanacetum cinerariifolium]
DISSIIDPRLSQVVQGNPFVEISNMTHDLPEGVVRFTNRTDEVAYKMPHKIEHYNSLSDLEKEPSYDQNYNENYYPHDSPSFPCCDNCGRSHETFHCQPIDQNVDFSGSEQIQTPQYPDVYPPSQEISEEVFQAKGDLMTSIQTFLEKFNSIPFEEKPQILSQAWDHPIFIHDNEKHSVQNEESLENSSNEIAASNSDQEKEEPPQDFNIRQLIREECCIEEKEVKNVMEQPAERETRIRKPLQNFRVIHKSSISLNNTSQNFLVYAVAPILLTKELEYSLSMEYEHLNITLETESDEVTKSNAKNLLPITSKCEVTLEDESKCDMPAKDDSSPAFTTFSNPLFNNNDNLDSSDNESLPEEHVLTEEFKVYSNPLFDDDKSNSDKLDPYCFNVESYFVESLLNRDTFINYSFKLDFLLKEFSGELAHINPKIKESDFDFEEEIHLIENLLYDNSSSRLTKEHNAEEERIKKEHVDYISRMEMLFTINPRPRPTVNANTIVESLPSLPIPVQDGDSQKEEIDIVTKTDELLPLGFKNNDSEGEIDVVDELHVDNSISNSPNEFFDNEASDFDKPPFP